MTAIRLLIFATQKIVMSYGLSSSLRCGTVFLQKWVMRFITIHITHYTLLITHNSLHITNLVFSFFLFTFYLFKSAISYLLSALFYIHYSLFVIQYLSNSYYQPLSATDFQRGFLKLTKRSIATILIVLTVFTGTGLIFLFNPFGGIKEAEAAWFNDNWSYRKRIDLTVTTNASDRTNVDLYLTVDTTGITANLQTNCEDLRFTSTGGTILPYYIQSCNDNSATNKIWVRADLVPKNSTVFSMYMYYGNSTASAGSNSGLFNLYNGLQAYWSYEETSAWATNCSTQSVLDLSGNSNNGAPCPNASAATQNSSGKFGSAGNFDGTNDYILANNSSSLNISGSWTVSTWFYDANSNYNHAATHILCKANTDTDGSYPYCMQIDFNQLRVGYSNSFTYTGGSTRVTYSLSGGGYTSQNWTLLTATHDSTTNTITVYLNGTQVAQESFGTANVGGTPNLNIGRNGRDGDYWNGRLDDTRIYNRVLRPDEVTQLYNTHGSIAITPSFASEEKSPSPVAYWKFDEGQGQAPEDVSTIGNDGILGNTSSVASDDPTWITEDRCISGKCLWFDGSNDWVRINDSNSLDVTTAATIQYWVKPNVTTGGTTISKWSGTTGNQYTWYHNVGTEMNITVEDDGNPAGGGCSVDSTNASFQANSWYFISITFSAGTVTMYKNGLPLSQSVSGSCPSTFFVGTSVLEIGSVENGSADFFKGYIDEPKIFNQALTAAQIKANYNARGNPEGISAALGANNQNTPGALSNGLVGYWKMDESAANSCSGGSNDSCDSSGNGNDAGFGGTTSITSGKFANSTQYGTGDQSQSTSSVFNPSTTSFTIATWINVTDSESNRNIVSQHSGDTLLRINSTNTLHNSSGGSTSTSATIVPSTWQHIAVSVDITALKKYLFINGQLVTTADITLPTSNTGVLNIGTGPSLSSPAQGKLDELRVYNRALSGAEVSQLYNWAPGPIGYWKMDDSSGTTAVDFSGNGNNLTLSGTQTNPYWVTGKYGKALSIDSTCSGGCSAGTSGDVNAYDLPTNTAITLSLWHMPLQVGWNYTVFEKKLSGATGDPGYNLQANGVDFDLSMSDGTNALSGTSCGFSLSDGVWAHLAVTIDRATNNAICYQNGIKKNTISLSSITGSAANSESLYILKTSPRARADDAKIYNYVRTQAQIIEDMNAGHPAPGSPVGTPLGHWRFDEGADNMCSGGVNDVCNNGNGGNTYDGTSTADRTNAGKFNKALDFVSTNGDVVTISNNTAIDMDGNLATHTFSGWVYADSDGENDTGQIYSKSAAGTDETYLRVDSEGGGVVDLECQIDRATTDTNVNVTDAFAISTWHYVACSWDGTSLRVYVDGIEKGSSSSGSGAIDSDSHDLLIGGGTSDNFDGKIDEFKVYNQVLTAEQIKLDMNRGASQVLGALSQSSNAPANSGSSEYCPPDSSASICTGPVAEYKFDEGSGTTLNDTSGTANTGTISGASYVNGKYNKSLSFNGTSDYVSIADSNSLDLTTSFSIEAWVNIAGTPVDGNTGVYNIFNKGRDSTSTYAYNFDIDDNRKVNLRLYDGSNNPGVTSVSALTIGTWYHVVGTYDGTNLRVYVNGKYENTTATTVNPGAQTTDAAIGKNAMTTNRYFNGKIDQLRVFNYARSDTQAAWSYSKGKPVAHWRIDECQGTTINDASGNNLSGVLSLGAGGTTSTGTCTTSGAWFNGVTGKRNYSLDFDGTDDLVTIADNYKLDPAGTGWSVSLWANPASANQNVALISKRESSGNFNQWSMYICGAVDCNTSGQNLVGLFVQGPTVRRLALSTADVADGNWHNFVMVADPSADIVKLYMDGKLLATTTQNDSATWPSVSNAIDVKIANNNDTAYFDGQIDDVRVFDFPLNSGLVTQIYNDGAIRFGPSSGAP